MTKRAAWRKIARAFERSANGDTSQRDGVTYAGLCYAVIVVAAHDTRLYHAMKRDLYELADTAGLCGWWWPAFGDDGFRAKRDHGERAMLATILAESAED